MTALGGACDADSDSDSDSQDDLVPTRLHVSPAEGDDAVALAAVVDNDAVTVYVCGGGDSLDTHTRWFFSMPVDAAGDFTGDDDGWTLAGNITSGTLAANLSGPSGETPAVNFVPVVVDGGATGLYTHAINGCITGVVAWEDATQAGGLGFQGAWCNDEEEFGQVIILQPDSFTAAGGEARVDGRDDVPQFSVLPF